MRLDYKIESAKHALQRIRQERRGCKRCVTCAGSVSLGPWQSI
jgi:hypothetical protein